LSINQYNMNNLISLLDNQKPGKRKFYGPSRPVESNKNYLRGRGSRKPAFRPAGIISLFEQNTRLINKIEQNPARISHRNSQANRNILPKPRVSRGRPDNANLSFTFPALPIAALALLMLGFFFILHNQSGAFDFMGRDVVNAGKDPGSQYNLSLYAGIYPAEESGIIAAKPPDTGIPLDLTETFTWHTYRVKRGDTVSGIALNFSISLGAVIASNGISNAHSLREGQVLRIPNMDGLPYTVKERDTLSDISRSIGVPLEAILDANDIQSDLISAGMTLFIPGARMRNEDLKLALGELFVYPLRGARLSSPFGWRNDPFTGVRRYHAAIDLSAPQGTPIKAAMDGVVSVVGYDNNLGNFIIISHSGGFQTSYAHLHTSSARKGDQVRQGTQIGTVGSTGYSTGPHLHFAIYKNGRAVNPLDLLSTRM
jgi:murein DD-endopeptidase MepM/ murein hydrolase activator NlpD